MSNAEARNTEKADVKQQSVLENGKLIKQGAEARIFIGDFEGKKAILKERFKKTYRQPDLDRVLTKRRIKNEVKLLKKAVGLGLIVPEVYKQDAEMGHIIMQYIDNSVTSRDHIIELAKKLHETDDESTKKSINDEFAKIAKLIGKYIGMLHRNEVIHGDLTTSNFLIRKGDNNEFDVVFIDFGLSFNSHQLEDKAVDLYVLERALNSTHSKEAKQILDVILSSYCEEYGRHNEKVMERLAEVRLRGRKRSMVG